MDKRLRKLRRELDLTQSAFADRIGMKQNTIATYEMGRSIPSDQTIRSICREFNVREEWLRNGTGEMFEPASSSALDALAAEFHLDRAAYVAVEKFINLPPDAREGILSYMREVASTIDELDLPPDHEIPETPDELEDKFPPVEPDARRSV